MAFISLAKHSKGNEDVNTTSVSTASTNVPTASANIEVASISQDTACSYIASQSSSSQIKFEDINQIDEDYMEEMDIKWSMALLSMRADKAPRSQDRGRRDNYRQGSKVEEQAPKALMAINGVGWDWSYMANDEEDHALVDDEAAPTEFALMANTSAESKVFDNSICSKEYKKNNDSLNRKITDLTDKLFDAKNMIYHYKLGLAQVESRLVEHKDREIKYCEKIRGLEFRIESNNECIEILKKELETLNKEKEGVDGKLAGFLTASKNLENLIESQRADKNKDGLGYSVVPPPPAQIYSSPNKDLSWTGLPEFVDDTVTDNSRPSPTMESTSGDDQNRNPSISETKASPSTITPKPFIKFVKASGSPTKSKIDKAEKTKKSPVKYAEQYRKPNKKPNVRGNQRNWNNLKSHQLGPNFVMKKKACFNYGDFNHLAYDYRKRVKKGTSRYQDNTYKSFTPRLVTHRPYRPPVRPVRTNMNGARPNKTTFNKQSHSYANRPFQRTSAVRSQYRAPWVPTVNRNFPPVNRKFSTGSRNFPTANRKFLTASKKFHTGSMKFFTADMGMKGKAGSSKNNIDDKGYWDSGCSRHMTGNISYLSDYEPFDGGYVSFGQGGCNITGKGTIKTGKLKFENVYFVKDLKDFKLLDDANILLRTPRQHNIYSIDLNNIVPHKDLTCLVAKASADECMLWHRRLGHLNFKTMNRLVRYNLVRGLPTKCFENDHTCTACLKGKQHKASFTDDFSRFTWTFFLNTKDETSGILKKFITEIKNLKDLKVKIIRCDNGGEFRNKKMNDLYSQKGIKREFSNARTPQQNGVAERRNRTLIEAARTMLADAKLHDATSQEVKKNVSSLRYIALPNWAHDALLESSSSKPQDHCSTEVPESSGNLNPTASTSNPLADQMETLIVESPIPTVSSPVLTVYSTDSQEPSSDARLISKRVANQVETPSLDNILTLTNRFEDILGVTTSSDEANGVEADIIGPVDTPIQTRNKSKEVGEQSFIAIIHQKTDPAVLQFCLFSCFLSQVEPKKISDALQDPSWVEAMQEELLQFKIQNVWTLVDCPKGVRPIGIKWVLKNKKDKRWIVIINKARLVAQGHTQEEGIDYDEVFAPVARIEAIKLFLAYASFMGFTVYQMDVKSAFLYNTIDEEVYVMQPSGFQDPEFPVKVYKVEKAMYGLHQAPRAWYGTLSKFLLINDFQRGDILKKFGYSDVRSSNTPMDKENPWGKDGTGKDIDLHLYRSMIGSLIYLTASRPNIMFAVCACARHQVTPKECHLHAVKRIFRYLKGHPKLGLWYPKESPFDLVAYSDSDYGGATQDRKSTTGGCQFLGRS
nr:retrotransposon protein, putative, Ty1-copia subclass [Tanacetum cinerariifolium]